MRETEQPFMDDMKKKFRELAKKLHPGQGGDNGLMAELNDAYNEARRGSFAHLERLYDKFVQSSNGLQEDVVSANDKDGGKSAMDKYFSGGYEQDFLAQMEELRAAGVNTEGMEWFHKEWKNSSK
ncbi:MAG: hypothetical protein COT81_00790 [Candidatus Buchananbacteria bacterium CG10_big_fil_rev_8_21_14_0_10_42_9]|uniref:J domain-containing protein n=1 Tax=Candidatus Buchananbacteria bacterium CG10_big_fil_rev_8_21_14_0_10_42_9 TaxID=1974526 RepID=A0A2H0W2H2_9BACT|nr:MAG: hypothetical protein COT81_00790 [Candidatus Buchananbacteria bacterium CG10_big_fil_rev_8_21_14_0_10_42_9]